MLQSPGNFGSNYALRETLLMATRSQTGIVQLIEHKSCIFEFVGSNPTGFNDFPFQGAINSFGNENMGMRTCEHADKKTSKDYGMHN